MSKIKVKSEPCERAQLFSMQNSLICSKKPRVMK